MSARSLGGAAARKAVAAVNDYGMDAELAAKSNAKYDQGKEAEAKKWIEDTLKVRLLRSMSAVQHVAAWHLLFELSSLLSG